MHPTIKRKLVVFVSTAALVGAGSYGIAQAAPATKDQSGPGMRGGGPGGQGGFRGGPGGAGGFPGAPGSTASGVAPGAAAPGAAAPRSAPGATPTAPPTGTSGPQSTT